ncbi:MAG: amino acid ABC transporter permease [Candidatus Izemoplasma sp.]
MDIDYVVSILPYILEGLETTLLVFVFALVFSLIIGITLGVTATSKYKVLNRTIWAYTWIFRGTPLLLQLYFGMYGLPSFGIVLDRLNVAILIFSLNYGAYFTEIIRGSILSIDKGQFEVSKTLGFGYIQTYIFIIIPQAIKRSIQAVGNETITLVKDTALIAAIALNDLLRNAKEIVSRDFRVEAFFVVGVIYIMLSLVIVYIFKKFEKKYSYFR